ncbi:MAG: YdbL family protein [Alphaproteobacteria bacterium]|nr:YdbL family protein [Alphaproteobacteria bacterium]
MTRALKFPAFVVALLVCLASFAALDGALARPLEAERKAGLVGDQADGYLGVVKPPAPADVQRQVDELNLKRRNLYRDKAKELNTSLQAVEAIYGKQLYEQTPSGEYFRGSDGAWAKKP